MATIVDSYGTTESGAIASDGRRIGSKWNGVSEVRLVSCAELGFRTSDRPHPRGEVVVRSPSLALGYLDNAEAERAAFEPVSQVGPLDTLDKCSVRYNA